MDWLALAQLGGFAFAAMVMATAAKLIFDAWRRGDMIARPVWERSEARADLMAAQLERNTEALSAHTTSLAQLAKAAERQAVLIEKLLKARGT